MAERRWALKKSKRKENNMQEINESVLQIISGEIEKLLIEEQEGIAFAYNKIPDGIKISIGVNLDPTSKGVEVNYTVNYPLEASPDPAKKQTIKKKQIINEGQSALFETVNNIIPKKGSGIDSMTITAGGESVTLEAR
jgi:hypothetical protein